MRSMVLCEKPDQARSVRKAVQDQYGRVYAAAGHLARLQEPEEVKPEWKNWSAGLLWPGHFYEKVASADKESFLGPIREGLASSDRVILATDPDREGCLLGYELLELFDFKGEVLRPILLATDPASIRKAFAEMRPFEEYRGLYNAGRAREQGDLIVNLSLTRTASSVLREEGTFGTIGVGRVKSPALGMVARREQAINSHVSVDTFQIDADVRAAAGTLTLTCQKLPNQENVAEAEAVDEDELNAGEEALQEAESLDGKIFDKGRAERLAAYVLDRSYPLRATTKKGSQKPPKLFDLSALQAAASSRFGWTGDKTLEVAQLLYLAGAITYPRSDEVYLPEANAADIPTLLPALLALRPYQQFADLLRDPIARKGKAGHFSDTQLKDASHFAIIPNVECSEGFARLLPGMTQDEKNLFNLVAIRYLAALSPNFEYFTTQVSMSVPFEGEQWDFRTSGRVPRSLGWRRILGFSSSKEDTPLPSISDGEAGNVFKASLRTVASRPPSRFSEGSLIKALKQCWRLVGDDQPDLKAKLKECSGIGTPVTRGTIVKGLLDQGQLVRKGKVLAPSEAGMKLFEILDATVPNVVDVARTAAWETLWSKVQRHELSAEEAVGLVLKSTEVEIANIVASPHRIDMGGVSKSGNKNGKPSPGMIKYAEAIAKRKNLALPRGLKSKSEICRAFLTEHGEKRERGADSAPSERSVTFARTISEKLSTDLPTEVLQSQSALSAWIKKHKDRYNDVSDRAPSEGQITFAQNLSAKKGVELPGDYKTSWAACTAFIDKHKQNKSASKKPSPRHK